jgi:hypothetical protein
MSRDFGDPISIDGCPGVGEAPETIYIYKNNSINLYLHDHLAISMAILFG